MLRVNFWSRLPRRLSTSICRSTHDAAARTSHSQPFEEERLPWYRADQFYPVRIGEVLGSKYKVVGKLGYGAYSTVWLCRDTKDAGFIALKVCTRDKHGSTRNDRELRFYEHVSSLGSEHSGRAYIRGLFETFEIDGPAGMHSCLVQPPMHMTVREFQCLNSSKRLNKELLDWTLSNLLKALTFLHDEAEVVHTDISPSNIMLSLNDESLLTEFERAEAEEPSPKKVVDEIRTIYGSRKFGLPKDSLWGQPVLCDFGQARIGRTHKGLIQPELYRAPEVLFDMEWNTSVDIWNVAALASLRPSADLPVLTYTSQIWDLFEGRHLFSALDEAEEVSATHHVAKMVGYLGDPPLNYLSRSRVTNNVFDEKGHWKGAGGVVVPQMSLERAETILEGEEKTRFRDFVKSMLRWVPEERRRAADLLSDPWLK